MDRPEVTLANYDAVYDFYRDHQQPRLLARAAYAMLAARYRPHVHYRAGARDALRAVIDDGAPLVIVANHLTHSDQYTLAATAWRSPLRTLIGRTRVLAKDELFRERGQRREVDMMGGIPVFRAKNHGVRAVADAGRRMMDIAALRLSRGDAVAIFPEGTCNTGDPIRIQAVGSGVGHIVRRAAALGARPALVTIGIAYGPDNDPGRPASVFITIPVPELTGTPREITHRVADELQCAVDGAVARY
ncbi:lysophospholipid acyltransferase family protein [Rhodococcus zopfii]|uniref:lysophospholipid acyltransferase family protein n=1 Tax=Rhodococcus zopfii TaxID=43772 RepID=UPI0009355F5C|nr:1-acyl-sn-glycerol-3-phosphate acyltransferase [Rhodococcus zopfii]